jgi:hypothetical protein
VGAAVTLIVRKIASGALQLCHATPIDLRLLLRAKQSADTPAGPGASFGDAFVNAVCQSVFLGRWRLAREITQSAILMSRERKMCCSEGVPSCGTPALAARASEPPRTCAWRTSDSETIRDVAEQSAYTGARQHVREKVHPDNDPRNRHVGRQNQQQGHDFRIKIPQ